VTEARFVHIVDDVPELEGRSDSPVLVTALDGFLDAGNAAALAVGHLTDSEPGRVVAVFEVDEFYDYRARRPPLTFLEDHYADYEAPRLVVRLMEDNLDAAYLLLTGPEPDIRWEAFARAVRTVVEHFSVRLVVSLGSVPMAVPHTRPVQLTNHATAQRLLVQENVWKGDIRVPASAQSLIELRLGEWGHDAMGFVAHIPHYVAQFDYPHAAAALLEGLEDVTGLQWDQSALKEAGEARQVEIATQIADSDDVREVVTGLEQQYDAFHRQASNLLAEDEPLPSGEEIGAQFEQFLARLEEPEGD
jgi:predicted ATP-grasp superfamily ATP-dependent carboligase